MRCDGGCSVLHKASECGAQADAACCDNCHRKAPFLYHHFVMAQKGRLLSGCRRAGWAVSRFSLARFGMMMGQGRWCARLFEGTIDWQTTPGLGTLQPKDLGDGGSHIELHHHVGNLISLLDALAADDKGSLHLE